MLKNLTVLGTGTIIPVPGRKCAGYLLETDKGLMLIDCGPGILIQLTDIKTNFSRINQIFLTHFHFDHISDLFALIISISSRGYLDKVINITGPSGTLGMIKNAKKYFLSNEESFKLENMNITEISDSEYSIMDINIKTKPTNHTDNSLCYRFEDSGGNSFFYSGDTDFNNNIVELGRDVNLAVVECSHSDNFNNKAGHMTWSKVLQFYDKASPGKMVLSHFYQDFLDDGINEKTIINKSILLANDKDIFYFKDSDDKF